MGTREPDFHGVFHSHTVNGFSRSHYKTHNRTLHLLVVHVAWLAQVGQVEVGWYFLWRMLAVGGPRR